MEAQRIDLERLALWFSGPAVLCEFGPNSPTGHAQFPEPLLGLSPNQGAGASIAEAIDDELCAIADAHERIAVLLSGGLDSAAVLYRLSRTVPSERIVAVAADLTDDQGNSSAEAATRIAEIIDNRIEIVRATPHTGAVAEWSPMAPRLDAAPLYNDALIRAAIDCGCSVALTGNGGDELFAAPRFLLGQMAKKRLGRKLASYIGDTVLYSWEAVLKEPAGILADLMPRNTMRWAYDRIVWPENLVSLYPGIVDEWHGPIREWSGEWRARVLSLIHI